MVKTMAYQWKTIVFPVDAQEAGEELENISKQRGSITPDIVVEEATPEGSKLHNCFLWDDSKAANNYRKQQARILIDNLVQVIYKESEDEFESDKEITVRAFVHVYDQAEDTTATNGRYVTMTSAMGDKDFRKQVLKRAMGEFIALKNKYSQLKELSKLFADIDDIAKQIKVFEKSTLDVL